MMKKKELVTYLWKDRRRRMGMPLSFTRYRLSEDRIFRETGFFSLKEEEVLLYRVSDLELRRNLWQRMFNMGTVCVHSSDKTTPHLDLKNVRDPKYVKELIFRTVEAAKDARRIRAMEVLDGEDFETGDGLEEDICDSDN